MPKVKDRALAKLRKGRCSRCSSWLSKRWEQAFNTATIDICRASQIFSALRGNALAGPVDFDWWHKAHTLPMIEHAAAQHVIIKYGGCRDYMLCDKCHDELIGVIGKFFGFDK